MATEESVTWHAENVAHVIKRMHQLQKKMERELVALEKESPNNPGGINEKFGVENKALLEAIDRTAHFDKNELEEAEANIRDYIKKFTTLDNGLRARRAISGTPYSSSRTVPSIQRFRRSCGYYSSSTPPTMDSWVGTQNGKPLSGSPTHARCTATSQL